MIHTPIAAIRALSFPNKSAILGNAFWRKTPANETTKLINTAAPKRCVKSGGYEVGELMNKAKTAWKVRPRTIFPRLVWGLLGGGEFFILMQIGRPADAVEVPQVILLIPGFLPFIALMKEYSSFISREICSEHDSIGKKERKKKKLSISLVNSLKWWFILAVPFYWRMQCSRIHEKVRWF